MATSVVACLSFLAPLIVGTGAETLDLQIVTKVRLTADRIEYVGLITMEANQGVFDLYRAADPKPTTLLIESRGGAASAGMQLGTWMLDTRMNVQVDTFCFSSCANYVFLAGRNKFLAQHAALMWHGGVTQPISMEELAHVLDAMLNDMAEDEKRDLLSQQPREELLAQFEYSLIELRASEQRFFERIGVDQRITVLGHLYERELLRQQHDYAGWDLSLDDLNRLGVRGIQVINGESWKPDFPRQSERIYRIHLENLPDFRPQVPGS